MICAGQECYAHLFEPVKKAGNRVFLIGGAQAAGELDGKSAECYFIFVKCMFLLLRKSVVDQ